MLFRYGEQMRWTKLGIAYAIRGRAFISTNNSRLVRRGRCAAALASTETNRKAEIRDPPIRPLLAVYGLRVKKCSGFVWKT